MKITKQEYNGNSKLFHVSSIEGTDKDLYFQYDRKPTNMTYEESIKITIERCRKNNEYPFNVKN